MITVFTLPKPFVGHIGLIQRNAIASWTRLDPGVQVLLLGNEPGTAEAAAELGVLHLPDVDRNEYGTPLLDSAFASARASARHPVLCFVNTDIVLGPDFAAAVRTLSALAQSFLMVGESWDTQVNEPIDFTAGWHARLVRLGGRRRGAGALDYFVFSDDLYRELPPFAVGRPHFDNWLVWRARDAGAVVVDASRTVRSIHENHAYDHVQGGFTGARGGVEARANWRLVGSKSRLYTRFDSTHLLTAGGLRPNLGRILRVKERGRKAVYKLRHGQLLPAREPG